MQNCEVPCGFLVIDKPHGWTSFDCVNKVRGVLERGLRGGHGTLPGGMKRLKVGHTGTLDPYATGILVIAVGKATKRIEELKGVDKEYVAEIGFGLVSETYDLDGSVLVWQGDASFAHLKVQLEDILDQFRGDILQIPPRFSALKVGGRRAYDLARKGKDFELEARRVRIDTLEIKDFGMREVSVVNVPVAEICMTVSSGTYVRALARDIGEALSVPAVLVGLRRTRVGTVSFDGIMSGSVDTLPVIKLSKKTDFDELISSLIAVELFFGCMI